MLGHQARQLGGRPERTVIHLGQTELRVTRATETPSRNFPATSPSVFL